MDLGVHLPLIPLGGPLSAARVHATVDAARANGFAALAANDHLVWKTPWLDGPTALASVIDRSGDLALATTVALPVVRGPAALAKALAALDLLSDGRLLAGVGPGSSAEDYTLAGVPFDERWPRFDAALDDLRATLGARAARPARLDRQLGLGGRPPADRAGGRRLARLRLQHDAGRVRRRSCRAGPGTRRPRPAPRRLPQCRRDHVDVGRARPGRARPRAA